MRILHAVEFYHPSKGGMQEVVRKLSERLVGLGHEVTVVTSLLEDRNESEMNGVKVVEFDISGSQVNGYKWGQTEAYREFLRDTEFDVVTIFAAQQWTCDLALPILPQVKAKRKIFVPTGFPGLYRQDYAQYYEEMKERIHYFDHLVFLSGDYRDILFARDQKHRSFSVIPNGADLAEFKAIIPGSFRQRHALKDRIIVLSVGAHTGLKGHKEAFEIYNRAALPNSAFVLIGNQVAGGCIRACLRRAALTRWFPGISVVGGRWRVAFNLIEYFLKFKWISSLLRTQKVLVLDTRREETVEAFSDADVFLFPSNLEASPVVLFECLAAGLPFIASDAGNSREIAEKTGAGMIIRSRVERDQCFVEIEHGVRLLKNLAASPQNRQSMSVSAGVAANEYSWDSIANRYEKLYREVLSKA